MAHEAYSAELSGPRGVIAYQRVGEGPPLLLLAGLGSRVRLWGELPRLLSDRFTVLAMENRGMGPSREGARFTLTGATDDAVQVIEHARLGPTRVLGVSMGGMIACQLAAQHPDAVDRMVVASCAARFTPTVGRVLRFFERALTCMSPADAAAALMAFAFAASFGDRYPGFVADAARLWAPDPEDLAGALAQQAHLLEGWDLRPAAAAIRCPTLVIAGALDPVMPASTTRELAAAIPGCRYLEVPEAAHSVLAEGGAELLDEVVRFLSA